MRNVLRVSLAIALAATLSCKMKDRNEPVSVSGAEQARPYQVPLNAEGHTVEQQNVLNRIKVTTDPTKLLWIHLIGLDGKIISRMPVSGKVTSSGKRLEPSKIVVEPYQADGSFPRYNGYFTDERIEADGTYGSSDPYIYWFDPMGRYHQYGTAGGIGYLLTDYPIDLANPRDEITGMYNANKAATAWQEEQEARLKGRRPPTPPPPAPPAEAPSNR